MYKRLKREKTHIGRFDIYMDTIEKDGKVGPYSFIDIKPSVCVIVKVENKYVLLKEYRYPIDSWEYEFPCGMIDENESAEQAAIREVQEETGYVVEEIQSLGFFYPSFGSTTEKIYLFFAECRNKKETHTDVLESIEYSLVEEEVIQEYTDTGKIACAAAIIAWLRYKKA